MKNRKFNVLLILITLLALTACGGNTSSNNKEIINADDPIIVGSFIDTEGGVLGNMIVLALEDNGYKITDKVQFGTPDVARNALLEGELHISIDYTGNGQYHTEGIAEEVWANSSEGYKAIRDYDKENNDLIWLQPAAANNTEMLAVKTDFAKENNIETLEDFADYVNNGGKVKFITSQSFAEKNMGLLGIEKAYGFKLTSDQIIMLPHGNTAETMSALANDTDGVNVALVYGTDGALPDLGLQVIKDPKSIPTVYEPSAVIRAEILEKYPEVEKIIEDIFLTLDLENLQLMNKEVIVDGKSAKDVAKEYLVKNNLLSK